MSDPELTGVHARRRLSIALLAMMPLFVIYEASRAAVAAEGHNWRNTAEVLFSEPIELLGGGAEWRWLLLAIVAVAALVRAWKLGVNWGEGVLWSMLEGGAIGILLGPLMMLLLGGVFGWLPEAQLGASAASVAPPISRAGLELSGAVWEELLFRFVVLAAVYQLGRWLFSFLDREDNERSRWPAEVLAIAVSSLAFAASHLEVVVGWLGYGGETYEFTLFAWRAFAGLLLAAIARSRGLGVAAWAHAMFNLGLILGSGPGVFLGQPG